VAMLYMYCHLSLQQPVHLHVHLINAHYISHHASSCHQVGMVIYTVGGKVTYFESNMHNY